jgi:hypothetical protein
MPGNSAKRRRQRLRMWAENPCCRVCNRLTIPPECLSKKAPNEFWGQSTTIDHRYTKYQENRWKWQLTINTHRLLCRDCNNRLGAEVQSRVPIEELRRRSKRHARSKPLCDLKKH